MRPGTRSQHCLSKPWSPTPRCWVCLNSFPGTATPTTMPIRKGAVRQLLFGADNHGIVIYLILDDQLCVDVLEVMWAG